MALLLLFAISTVLSHTLYLRIEAHARLENILSFLNDSMISHETGTICVRA